MRFATLKDSKQIFDWRNDAVSRSMSASANIVKWSEHAKWYKTALLNPNCVIIVGEDAYGSLGMVRFDYDNERTQAEVSINLNPSRRGENLSSSLLSESIGFAIFTKTIRLTAQIKHQNIVSIRSFTKCGFHYQNADEDYIFLVKLM